MLFVKKQNHLVLTVLNWDYHLIWMFGRQIRNIIEYQVTLDKYGLQLFCISNHLVGQAICDNIDQRHKSVLPDISGAMAILMECTCGRSKI